MEEDQLGCCTSASQLVMCRISGFVEDLTQRLFHFRVLPITMLAVERLRLIVLRALLSTATKRSLATAQAICDPRFESKWQILRHPPPR
jgi:hypothetical protein